MTSEEEKKIWKSLWTTFALGCTGIVLGLSIYYLGNARKLFLIIMCAYVFGGLAIGMSLFKMAKFKKFLKTQQD
ncbi:MAG: hypothetical protein ACI8ZM_000106 [Crocinitomix sp.]|jgi:hypothetical protein